MSDATYANVYFSYFLFFLLTNNAVLFFIRSLRDGYLGSDSEEPKYHMLQDDEDDLAKNPRRTS